MFRSHDSVTDLQGRPFQRDRNWCHLTFNAQQEEHHPEELFFAEVEIDPVDVIQVKNCVLMCPDSGMHACMYAPSD